MNHSVTIRHNFETAHRLPQLGGKCVNLHGHSWWCEIEVTAASIPDSVVVEFGAFKGKIRQWIDTYLDHGVMLGAADDLVPVLLSHHCKLYRFGAGDPSDAEKLSHELAWPTVENVAILIGRVGSQVIRELDARVDVQVSQVNISETHVNSATWRPHGHS
ncbi:6-pyruvoyl trahydropterin synthase family protein [Streptomyces sp. NPDC020681]|uniref:6-pyruvoyl trahydropterin synthase family protein n=1 Tax=Streptomyces sp. NPDC020681 TaxID=3365083 RepID=UPI0037B798D0